MGQPGGAATTVVSQIFNRLSLELSKEVLYDLELRRNESRVAEHQSISIQSLYKKETSGCPILLPNRKQFCSTLCYIVMYLVYHWKNFILWLRGLKWSFNYIAILLRSATPTWTYFFYKVINIHVQCIKAVFFELFICLNSRQSSQPITCMYVPQWPIAALGDKIH